MGLEILQESPSLILRSIFNIIRLTFTLLLLLSLPIVLIHVIINVTIRKSVDILAHIVHGKDLKKLVTLVSSLLAADDIHEKPKANLLTMLTVEGNFEIARLREIFIKNVLNAKQAGSCSDGELKYPELQQFIVNWGGYYFWKDCPDFKLEEHVRLYDEDSGGISHQDEDIILLRDKALNQKWERNKPTWELVLVHNCYPQFASNPGPHTTIFVRWHHSAGDGYSWLHLIIDSLCQRPKFKNALPSREPRSLASSLLYWASFVFRGTWAFAEFAMFFLHSFDWRVTADQRQTESLHVVTKPISVESIREIKTHFGVSFASVLHTILSGVHWRMLERKGFRVPKQLPCWMTLPLPGHSLKLRNHMTGCAIWLPTLEKDPVKRLLFCHEDIESRRNTIVPIWTITILKVAGLNPSWVTRILVKDCGFPTGISNFPGGMETIYADFENKQHPCVDAYCVGGIPSGKLGVGFEIVSYCQSFRICSIADSSIFSREEMDFFNDAIYTEIEALKLTIV